MKSLRTSGNFQTMEDREARLREAGMWLMRERDPGFSDWMAFTIWLEAHPENAEAYREVRLIEEDLVADYRAKGPGEPIHEAANEDEASARPPVFAGRFVALAMSVVLLLASAVWFATRNPLQTITADSDTVRIVQLKSGDRIVLQSGAAIDIPISDERYARLRRGEAYFDVEHRPDVPFVVDLPNTGKLTDLGTAFSVRVSGREVAVGVSEGAVHYSMADTRATVTQGQSLHAVDGRIEVKSVNTQDVASWAGLSLAFTDAPLERVAEEISRKTGVRLFVSPPLRNRLVTASVYIDARDEIDMEIIARLLGVSLRAEGDGWIFVAD